MDFTNENFHFDEATLLSIRDDFHLSASYRPIITGSKRIVSIYNDYKIRIADQMTGQVITEFETIHDKGIRRIAVWEHGAESLIITGSSDSALRIFDFNGHLVRELLGNFGRVQSFIVSHEEYDGDFLVIAAGEDRSIKVWGLRDGELKFTCFGHTNEIVGLAFCVGYSSKSVIASLDKSGEIRFWDRKNGNCLRKLG